MGGGALNVAVETAVEVLTLARDGLEVAYRDAVKSEEPLDELAGKMPLQAVMLAARVRFTRQVDAVFKDCKPVQTVLEDIKAAQASIIQQLHQDLTTRKRAALGILQALLQEQQDTAVGLVAAWETGSAAEFWENEVRVLLSTHEDGEDRFECQCAGKTIPVFFEYNPCGHSAMTESTRKFRRAFFEAFDFRAAGPKVLAVSACASAGIAEVGNFVCAMVGVTPIVLNGSELPSTERFWYRATAAAKSSNGGGVLAVIIVEEADQATRTSIDCAVMMCKEKRVALCLIVDPNAPKDYKILGRMDFNLLHVELATPEAHVAVAGA